MEPIITINEYPIGWEWLDRVPLEDFTWNITNPTKIPGQNTSLIQAVTKIITLYT